MALARQEKNLVGNAYQPLRKSVPLFDKRKSVIDERGVFQGYPETGRLSVSENSVQSGFNCTASWYRLLDLPRKSVLEYSTFHTVGLLVLALSPRSHVSEGQAASLCFSTSSGLSSIC